MWLMESNSVMCKYEWGDTVLTLVITWWAVWSSDWRFFSPIFQETDDYRYFDPKMLRGSERYHSDTHSESFLIGSFTCSGCQWSCSLSVSETLSWLLTGRKLRNVSSSSSSSSSAPFPGTRTRFRRWAEFLFLDSSFFQNKQHRLEMMLLSSYMNSHSKYIFTRRF